MDAKQTQTGTDNHLGITFSEIHSDEPHEAVKASKTEVTQTHTPTTQSHLSNKDDVFNVTRAFESGHIEAGTIVSDKKDSRPSFGKNIASAFSEWWGTTKNTLDDSATKIQAPLLKKAEPVISKVETRVEVVKSAATHTTMAPKDDHRIVIQKIRTFKQDVARVQNTPIVVKEQSVQKSGWTHTDQKPAEPAKKIELEKLVASVAAPQKMIPTPPQKEKREAPQPTQPTPIPVPPSAHIPKPPKKVIAPEKPLIVSIPVVTEVKRVEVPTHNTPRMSVPEMVVKKDISLPKKNIWVAPRIQPESSVLVPHNTPTPVSQSFIPSQNSTPSKVPDVVVPTPPIPAPTPLATPMVAVVSPVQKTPSLASVKPFDKGQTEPFHSITPITPVETPKVEVQKPTSTPVPSVPQPIAKPVLPPVAEITVLKEIPKATPAPIVPVNVIAQHVSKPEVTTPPPVPLATESRSDQTQESRPFISDTPPQRATPPHILKSSLYKKAPTESSAPSTPAFTKEPVRAPLHTPTPLVPTTPVPHFQEIPKQTTPESGGYANEIHTPSPTSTTFHVPEEMPLPASVPLSRPIPVIPPQPRIEVRPVVEERALPKLVEQASAPLIPRTPTPAPLPQRQTPMPPLERVISTPVSEQVVTPAPTNKAYRTFVRWAVIVLIILTGIALALFASIYFNVFKKETPSEQTTITVPTFIETTTQTPLMIEGTKEAFLSALKEKVKNATPGLTQFYPTVREGETTRPGSSAEILGFLNTHIDERTLKSLSPTIMIGSIATSKNEPFVVLQSTNFDVLFTGLLAWEPNLYADFTPLFGESAPSKIKFKDAVRDNTSTRILYDDAGNEILLYSFINQKTVVITTSGEALSELIKQF